jgi:hypothetical protein
MKYASPFRSAAAALDGLFEHPVQRSVNIQPFIQRPAEDELA